MNDLRVSEWEFTFTQRSDSCGFLQTGHRCTEHYLKKNGLVKQTLNSFLLNLLTVHLVSRPLGSGYYSELSQTGYLDSGQIPIFTVRHSGIVA